MAKLETKKAPAKTKKVKPKGRWQFRYEMYQHLALTQSEFFEKVKKIPKEVGFPDELRNKIGLTGTISENHGLLRKEITAAMEKGARTVINNATLDKEVRHLVKLYYGDEYDAVCANTCEALLQVSFDTLFSPPWSGRGDSYRSRYIAPYEKHLHHQGAYGRPFPPRYKDLFGDRGVTSGEFGQLGKRLYNLDTLIVPLEGAKYEAHGIKYHVCTLLSNVKGKESAQVIEEVARDHVGELSGITSLGYTHRGYGYGDKDKDGIPILQKELARVAKRFRVPYVIDNAVGLPFVCADIRKIGGDVALFSMDKASGGPTCGLAIGKEDSIIPMARALGCHSHRNGNPMAHGKASHVALDPGKEALLGTIATLKLLLDNPDSYKRQIDLWYDIVVDEFSKLDSGLRKGLHFEKDYSANCVEVDYEKTWTKDTFGMPIFSVEDLYAGTGLTMNATRVMGFAPCVAYDGNIKMSPGLGTTDENGELMEKPTRLMVRAFVRMLQVMCEHAGVLDQ
jgi:hypothetical protein